MLQLSLSCWIGFGKHKLEVSLPPRPWGGFAFSGPKAGNSCGSPPHPCVFPAAGLGQLCFAGLGAAALRALLQYFLRMNPKAPPSIAADSSDSHSCSCWIHACVFPVARASARSPPAEIAAALC